MSPMAAASVIVNYTVTSTALPVLILADLKPTALIAAIQSLIPT